jgi:hypothetical protein
MDFLPVPKNSMGWEKPQQRDSGAFSQTCIPEQVL